MTDQLPAEPAAAEPQDQADVEGHSVSRMMGMGQLNRTGQPSGGRTTQGEPADQELPPLTRRFPDMREGTSRTPKR